MTNEWYEESPYSWLGDEGRDEYDVPKIAAEAERRGRVAALEKLAQLVSAMTTKDPGGLSEKATHEDYYDKGYTVGVNVACMYTLKDIATLQTQEGQSASNETKHGLGGAAGLTPDDIKLFKA